MNNIHDSTKCGDLKKTPQPPQSPQFVVICVTVLIMMSQLWIRWSKWCLEWIHGCILDFDMDFGMKGLSFRWAPQLYTSLYFSVMLKIWVRTNTSHPFFLSNHHKLWWFKKTPQPPQSPQVVVIELTLLIMTLLGRAQTFWSDYKKTC